MASTILYKFRSGTTFEALPLPGTAARLFDVKKAIVKAKKLDSTGMLEFDLSVRNAATNEEYADESMLLPRGTRVIVQRLPAARGHGFLARMAKNEYGVTGVGGLATRTMVNDAGGAAPSGFYTIDSRGRDDDDEFVQSGVEDKELAALRAVTETATVVSAGGAPGGFRPNGAGGGGGFHHRGGPGQPSALNAQGGRGGHPGHAHHTKSHFRPNADPELREQEQKLMPKKRATGIPRTFLNLSAPPVTDGTKQDGDGTENVSLLQPNALGFEELVHRGGGQAESTTGTKKNLDYALKLTATSIPEYLQCGICHSVVMNAMLLPWDPEGRTACETCIRDALTQNGFRCPLTGIEGVSPDDLHPNHGLRKAAELFIKGVMEKMEEIEKQQVDEADDDVGAGAGDGADKNDVLEGDTAEKGVIVSRGTSQSSRRKKPEEEDPFGNGEDDFGGDVFAVESSKLEEEKEEGVDGAEDDVTAPSDEKEPVESVKQEDNKEIVDQTDGNPVSRDQNTDRDESKTNTSQSVNQNVDENHDNNKMDQGDDTEPPTAEKNTADTSTQQGRRERRRGPPVGYAMGPAGGAAVHGPHGTSDSRPADDNYHGGGRNGRGHAGRGGYSPSARGSGYQQHDRQQFRGRGRGGRHGGFQGGGRYQQGHAYNQTQLESSTYGYSGERSSRNDESDDANRGSKRAREESADDEYHNSDSRWDKHDRYGHDRHYHHNGGDYQGGGYQGAVDYHGGRGGPRDFYYDSRGRGFPSRAPYRSGGRRGGRSAGRGYGRGRF